MGELIEAVAQIFIAIFAGLLQLFVWFISILVSQTWLAAHRKGMRRAGHLLAITMAAYLLFGLARPFSETLWTPALSPIYRWEIALVAFILLIVGMAIGDTVRTSERAEKARSAPVAPSGPVQTQTSRYDFWIALIVFIVVLLGAASAITTERHEASLADKLCAQADARISDGLEQSVRDGAGLLDRVLGTQTANRIPCAND